MSEVDRILSERRRAHDKSAQWIAELEELNDLVQSLVTAAYQDAKPSTGDFNDPVWERVYDAVFSDAVSIRVFSLFGKLNMSFDWYDPDTTYEEDVVAFARALKERVAEL